MTVTTKRPQQVTAREKLRPSVLRETQLELMGDDVDLTKLYLKLAQGTGFNIIDAVTDVNIHRTIEGASTVEVVVEDRDRLLLNSGRLSSRNDIEIDGLYFRLVGVRKDGPELTLTFEDREVTLLRKYNKPIKQSLSTSRAQITRAEFVLRMIKEVKETKIRYVIPELHKQQPINGTSAVPPTLHNQKNKGYGIPKNTYVTVKNVRMTEEQRKNANIILQTGASRALQRRLLVMSIMCVIQESSIRNLPQPVVGAYNYLSSDPNKNPVGCFQQIKHWGWPASRDVATDAGAFFDKLARVAAVFHGSYYDTIEQVQHSGDAKKYAPHWKEAETIVTAFGLPPGSSADANATWAANANQSTYEFYRGLPPTSQKRKQKYGGKWGPENSWDCITRLAGDVQWRAFMVSGVFYFIAEDDLYKSQPVATIDEDSEGIDAIDGDYDEGKKAASLEITCRIGRWAAPPGSVIVIQNMGPWNGRWLVNDVERSAFNNQGRITLKKPLPRLPEPSQSNLVKETPDQGSWSLAPPPPKGQQYDVPAPYKVINPIPAGMAADDHSAVHETAGLAGYPAIDFFGKPDTPVLCVESGKVVKFSGHNPALGAIEGPGGPLGWSIYVVGASGSEYYYTHLAKRFCKVGDKVKIGQQIATIANYDIFGRPSHVHLGVHPGGNKPVTIDMVGAAPHARVAGGQ